MKKRERETEKCVRDREDTNRQAEAECNEK